MMDLYQIRDEINKIIKNKQQELELTFEEDTHTYTMRDKNGELRSDWPSVSKVMKLFYTEFDSDGIAEKKAKGDPEEDGLFTGGGKHALKGTGYVDKEKAESTCKQLDGLEKKGEHLEPVLKNKKMTRSFFVTRKK
jgi:hypothetical protein